MVEGLKMVKKETFWKLLTCTDEDDDELSTVVISLLQKNYREKERAGDAHAIGKYRIQAVKLHAA